MAMLVFCFACCSQEESGRAPPAETSQALDGGLPASSGVVYSFVDGHGRIRMASRVEDIPVEHRDRVLAVDTQEARSDRVQSDRLVVLDLRQELDGAPANYTLIDLNALGKPAGRHAPTDPGGLGRQMVDRAARGILEKVGWAPAEPAARVILYKTPWCGFCKKTADYLRAKGVTFLEKDIESDRAAALELSSKLQKAKLRDSGVPVLDIEGTLIIGFDQQKLDRLLTKK
jgi:glutaredoxin